MAEILLEDMLERIRGEVRRAPTDLCMQQLRDTIRDFCQITRAWQLETTNGQILALTSDYAVTVPGIWAQPIAIERLQIAGATSYFKTMEWLDSYQSDWRYRSADDFRYFTHVKTPATITFPCVPTVNGAVNGMKYRASFKPADDADRVPDLLVDEWIEAFSDGAKGKLKAMAGEPWADAKRALQLEYAYRTARTRARIRIAKSFGNSQDRWVNRGGFA